jgi:type VI secretion system protein ImpB
MDGKTGAEALIGQVLKDPTLLKTLASTPKPGEPGSEGEKK